MRVGSLFSGIGGLDLGLERAGMEIVWQVENDDWCTRVLERHWPHVARFRDVRQLFSGKWPQNILGYADLICGGFPCQSVSHAGRRMGESDSRWLWPEFHRIICEVRPRWVLAENVPGLLSVDSGRLFGGILRDLSEAGYDAVWFVLPAADVGAPHLRERVFVVAHADEPGSGERCPLAAGRAQPDRDDGDGVFVFRENHWRPIRESDWTTEPNVGRVAHGVPARVDRLRGLGNAGVPQVAEVIGRWIMETK